jgi:hypothetical protein
MEAKKFYHSKVIFPNHRDFIKWKVVFIYFVK